MSELGAPMPSRFPYAGAPQSSPGVSPSPGQTVRARYIIVDGTGGGVFVYVGRPGPGNPPIAWLTGAVSDPFGNSVTPQIGTRDNGTGFGVHLSGAEMVLAGLGSVSAGFISVQRNGSGSSSWLQTNVSGASDSSMVPQLLLMGESADASRSAYGILQAYDASTSQAVPITWQVNGAVAGTEPGSVSSGTPEGTPETWHYPALNSPFVTQGGSMKTGYKVTASGDTRVCGVLNLSSGTSWAGTVFTFPAGWFPSGYSTFFGVETHGGTSPSNEAPYAEVSVTGDLTLSGIPAGTNAVILNGFLPMDTVSG